MSSPLLRLSCPALVASLFLSLSLPDPALAQSGPDGGAIRLTEAEIEAMTVQSADESKAAARAAAAPTVESAADSGPISGFSVDTTNRNAVVALYHEVFLASEGYAAIHGWTGDVGACNEGATSHDLKEDVRRRVNYYRAMAGLPANITFNATKNAKAQKAALIMSYEGALSHDPAADFPTNPCLSADGQEAASKGNLSLGSYGPGAIDGLMEDDGSNNAIVGHRRWILYSRALEMGTGDIPIETPGSPYWDANCLWVIGDFAPAPATPPQVTWPPAGFVPYHLAPNSSAAFPRWSFSYPGANFIGATVTMSQGGANIPVVKETVGTGAGDNTLVWRPSGVPATAPDADTTYTVSITGISGAPFTTKTYQMTLIDPFRLNDEAVVSGSATPGAGVANTYQFNPIANASEYEAAVSSYSNAAWSEGAETSPTPRVIDGTDAAYDLLSAHTRATGSRAFHLCTPDFDPTEHVTIDRDLVPQTGSQVQFKYRRLFMYPDTKLRVQLSRDGGQSFKTIGTISGNNSLGESSQWDPASFLSAAFPVSAEYLDRVVRVRFLMDPTNITYTGTNNNNGIYLDDITLTNTLNFTGSTKTTLGPAATSFTYTPGAIGENRILTVSPKLGGRFWGGGEVFFTSAIAPGATLSVGDVSVSEAAGQATFTISLSQAQADPVTVDYTTADGTAVAGSDYMTTSGTATIPAGLTSVTVPVPLINDAVFEPDETFHLILSNPSPGVIISNATGVATITEDIDGNGFTDFEEQQLDAIQKQFAVGDELKDELGTSIDLSFLNLVGKQKLAVTGLPLGLTFNPTTKKITGTIKGLLGEAAVLVQKQGTIPVRSIPFDMLVSPYQFAGSYVGLLEAGPDPVGSVKVTVSGPGAYTARLNLAGQTSRSAKGTFLDNPGVLSRLLKIPFLPGSKNVPPATEVNMTIYSAAVSDEVSGNRDPGGVNNSLRGFRLSKPGRAPEATRKVTVAMNNTADPAPDGVAVPAGTGTLRGTVDSKGGVLLKGFTGDGLPITASCDLSQTRQCVFWVQPYANKTGYIGGILTIGDLGLPSRGASTLAPLADGLKWLKAADVKEKAYPLGFPVQTLTGKTSRWITPPNSTAMSESLGLVNDLINVSYRDPAPVVNPLHKPPTQFRLTGKYALLRTAPANSVPPAILVPWVGSASRTAGTFTGTPTFPAPVGKGSVNGVLLQDASFGDDVGTGLVRVPLAVPVPKPANWVVGSYQTISIDLANTELVIGSDGHGFTEEEKQQLDAIPKQFAVGDSLTVAEGTVIDLSFLSTNPGQTLSVTGLPRGLIFNPVTKQITGKILAMLGEVPVEIRKTTGKVLSGSILFNISVSSYPFVGNYVGLLEKPNDTPEGFIKLFVTGPGVATANLTLVGQAVRTWKGAFTGPPGSAQHTLTIPFLAGKTGVPAATTVTIVLDSAATSDAITGDRDGVGVSTLRGFRLSKPGRAPEAIRKVTVAMKNDGPAPDGVAVPAGTGTLRGTVGSKGGVLLKGFTGDGLPITASLYLSQTNQCVFWVQPYLNKTSYIGGILSIGDLGLPSRGTSVSPPLADGLNWLKAADAKEKAYPLGFPVQTLIAETSRWITPPRSIAMSESLGLVNDLVNASYRDPHPVVNLLHNLPTQFRLTGKFALLRTAPAPPVPPTILVPWVGSASRTAGTFTGTPTFPAPIGKGSVNGVLLQDESFGDDVGTGLVRVPLSVAPGRLAGSYQTISIDLAQ